MKRTDHELRLLWKRTDTPVIDVLVRKIEDEAFKKGHEINANDLAEILLEAFTLGYRAALVEEATP